MNILHIETGMHLYGGAQQVVYLLRELARQGVRNHLVCPPGSEVGAALAGEVAVYEVPVRGDLDLAAIGHLARIIRTVGPDLVHCHSRRGADVLGGIAAKWTGTPCVLSRRVDNPEPRWWVPLKYRLFDRVITISEGIRDVLVACGVPGGSVDCVRSAVDVDAFRRPADPDWFYREFDLPLGARVLGVAAQLIERKGHQVLLDALPSILEGHPDVHVLILGKGPLDAALNERVARAPYVGRVHMAGFRSDLPMVLPNLYALVHPAWAEGLGVALLQAAAAGLPVVACAAGGIPEAVADSETGLLSPPGDVAGLAANLERLLGDPELARRLGAAGHRRMLEAFSIPVMAAGNVAVYRRVLAGKSPD